jgi:hypothetical protein
VSTADEMVEAAKADVQKLSAGYRSSRVVGSNVVNDADEAIGRVDDLLIGPGGPQPFAVLSIGGFLGTGTHLVAIPFNSLKQ